jgi:hypothetical protein
MILSLADQLKDVSKNLYQLHAETDPIPKADDKEIKRKQLLSLMQTINTMEII